VKTESDDPQHGELRDLLTGIEIAALRASSLAHWKLKRGTAARLLRRKYDSIQTAQITGLPLAEVEAMEQGREFDHAKWIAEQCSDFEQRVGPPMPVGELEAVFQRIWDIRVDKAELLSPHGDTLEQSVRSEAGHWLLSREMWERDQFSKRQRHSL
jgi:hypothetical protein